MTLVYTAKRWRTTVITRYQIAFIISFYQRARPIMYSGALEIFYIVVFSFHLLRSIASSLFKLRAWQSYMDHSR